MSGTLTKRMKILTTDFTDSHRFFLNPCPSVLIRCTLFSQEFLCVSLCLLCESLCPSLFTVGGSAI